jgi:hypothetical protein
MEVVMYYNRILRVWVFDAMDYFLTSALIGSLLASYLKDYLCEKKARERLKNCIIEKSKLGIKSERTSFNYKQMRIEKIYRFALQPRGGQFENFQADPKLYKLALQIQGLVQRLAAFLKERELKGIARIFFKNGRIILELILCKCKIDISYFLLNQGLTTQVIVMTATAGGVAGFTISWFSVGASLVAPPLLISAILMRNIALQIINQMDYLKFKKIVTKMLEDKELKKTLIAVFEEAGVSTTNNTYRQMKPLDLDKNALPDLNLKSDQTVEEFIKASIKEKLGLVENPIQEQFEEIINRPKIKMKPKGKTVYLNDIIDKNGIIDKIFEVPDDIIDAEIVSKAIRLKVKNE